MTSSACNALFALLNLLPIRAKSEIPRTSNTSPAPDLIAPHVSPSLASLIVFLTPLPETALFIPSTEPVTSKPNLKKGLEYRVFNPLTPAANAPVLSPASMVAGNKVTAPIAGATSSLLLATY